MLSEQLFEKCEEFFDLISSEHRTCEVEAIIDHLSEYLLDDIDGRTDRESYLIAEEVEDQIQELWDLLPSEERRTNNNLRDYFDDIMETISSVLDGTSSDSDAEDYDDEDFGEEESDFDDEEEE